MAGERTIRIRFAGETKSLQSATDGAESSLSGVNRATDQSRQRMERVGEAADSASGKFSGVNEAAGALAGGFEAMGMEGAAAGIESAGTAADFASGSLDAMALAGSTAGNAFKRMGTRLAATRVGMAATTAATKVMTVAQRALNLVMRANPIGIIITIIMALVAAVMAAYKNSETFRNIVQKAWSGIQTAAKFAWEKVIKPALTALWGFLKNTLGPIFQWLWNTIIKPVWNGISAAIQFAWNNVIKPAWNSLKSGLSTVGDVFSRIGDSISGTWDSIKNGARDAVNWVIDKINSAIGGINSLIEGVNKIPRVNVPTVPELPRLAEGGAARAGTSYLVGEQGPELFTPSRSGHVTPNDELSDRGGGITVQHLEVKAMGKDFDLKQVQRQLAMRGVA